MEMSPAAEILLEDTDDAGINGSVLVIGGEAGLLRALRGPSADLPQGPANGGRAPDQRSFTGRDVNVPPQAFTWIPTDIRETADAPAGIDVRLDPGDPTQPRERFDTILIPAPPDRALTRRWLVLASGHLEPGGVLLIAGANAEGIRSAISDAARLFGAPEAEGYRRKQRVARFRIGTEHTAPPEWAGAPGIAPGTWQSFDLAIDGEPQPLALATLPGVFASERVDIGTRLLLDHLAIEPGESILDVGCGAGVIGFTALAKGAGRIELTDVNLLAVAACRRSVAEHGFANARVVAGDVYGAVEEECYDLIVSNPPFHQGKAIDYTMPERLIDEASRHLTAGGRLLIVANAFLAYGRRMEERFREVRIVASTRQYHVLEARHPR